MNAQGLPSKTRKEEAIIIVTWPNIGIVKDASKALDKVKISEYCNKIATNSRQNIKLINNQNPFITNRMKPSEKVCWFSWKNVPS